MLPRRLPPVIGHSLSTVNPPIRVRLPTPLFSKLFRLGKRREQSSRHSDFPYHAFAHCRGFAPAAPRRARVLVSVPFWGPPLSWPLQIIGLVSHYLANNHNPPQSHPKAYWLQFTRSLNAQAFQHRAPIAG